MAARSGVAFVGEELVGDALLDVVGFAGEDQQGFVLRLPAEAGDGTIVAGVIGSARDTELSFCSGIGSSIGQNGCV